MTTLDARNPLNKIQIKTSITDTIANQVVGSNRDDIARKVEIEYERLLVGAVILAHIPSLTAGSVRREVRASNMHRAPSAQVAADALGLGVSEAKEAEAKYLA